MLLYTADVEVLVGCRTGTGAGGADRGQAALEASLGATEAIGQVSTAVTLVGHVTSTTLVLLHMLNMQGGFTCFITPGGAVCSFLPFPAQGAQGSFCTS